MPSSSSITQLEQAIDAVLRKYIEDPTLRGVIGEELSIATVDAIDDVASAMTFRELEELATDKATALRGSCDQADPDERAAARDASLAITALEDAGIRYTRALAFKRGIQSNVDLEKLAADGEAERERARFEAQSREAGR